MKEFKAESKTLLGLMVGSIYANRDVFLRELISNASDAIDKAELFCENGGTPQTAVGAPEIRVSYDQEARTLCVSDAGVGMDGSELEEYLGTIAHSGSRQVKQALAREDHSAAQSLIGQFGVGFYSAFMVADRVTVISRGIGSDRACKWESDGIEGYEISPAERDQAGTDVILHVRESTADDNFERYLDQSTLVGLIKRYSDYIRHPIVMDLVDEKYDEVTGALVRGETAHESVVNAMVPPWEQVEGNVPEEDASAFYRREFQDEDDPLLSITVRARGVIAYDALLFVPSEADDELFSKDRRYGLRLYSRGVLIAEECESLLPGHLRFVRGVVEMKDVSLNVSRESVQEDARLAIVARQIEKSVMSELRKLAQEDRERYERFFGLFGTALKYAICTSAGMLNDVLSDLLLYRSAQTDNMVTLQEYVDANDEGKRTKILYAVGTDAHRLSQSPAVRALLADGRDVILCENGAQDELCFMLMGSFHGAAFQSVTSFNLGRDDEKAEGRSETEADKERDSVLEALFKHAPQPLAGVVASNVLTKPGDAASRIVTTQAMTISMAKYLAAKARQGQAPKPRFVLEVNCRSRLFARAEAAMADGDDDVVASCSTVLLGTALLAEDIRLDDPLAFNDAVNSLVI